MNTPLSEQQDIMDRLDSEPPQSALTAAHVVYGLHSFAILIGLLGAPTVVGTFLGSVPSIIAVIINYAKRGSVRGSWVESHYRWQIRTFWFALLWFLVAFAAFATVIGLPVGMIMLVALTAWLIYRIVRGWLRLADGRPMYV